MAGLFGLVRNHFGTNDVEKIADGSIGDGKNTTSYGFRGLQTDYTPTDAVGIGVKAMSNDLLGRFPLHADMQVMHLDHQTCRAITDGFVSTVDVTQTAFCWDEHVMRNGDVVMKMILGPMDTVDDDIAPCYWHVASACGALSGLRLGPRVLVLLPSIFEGAVSLMIRIGSVLLVPPIGYTHFGVSVPSVFLPYVCVHSQAMRAPCLFLRTGDVGSKVATKYSCGPTFNFSRPLSGELETSLIPDGVPLCVGRWSAGSYSTLNCAIVDCVAIAHFTLKQLHPIAVKIVVTDVGANVSFTFACRNAGFPKGVICDDKYDPQLDAVAAAYVHHVVTYGGRAHGVVRRCVYKTLFVGGDGLRVSDYFPV